MKRLSVITLSLAVLVMVCNCGKKKSYSELMNECSAITDSLMRLKSNDAFVLKATNEILKRHFSQIDTIIIKEKDVGLREEGRINETTPQLPQYFVNVVSKGKVVGTINGVKDEYNYNIKTEFIREFLESAFSSDYSLTLKDINDYYVADVIKGNKKDINKLNEEIKYKAQYDVIVDGIKVCFLSKDDSGDYTSLYYYSDKTLSDSQIKKVAKKSS